MASVLDNDVSVRVNGVETIVEGASEDVVTVYSAAGEYSTAVVRNRFQSMPQARTS